MEALEQLGIVPVDVAVLRSLFPGHRFSGDKVLALESEGKLIRLKKGLYVVAPETSGELLSLELVANHLYGPSYVSMESALRYHGLIPEQVRTVRSVTAGRSKTFDNPLGAFQYTHVDGEYYPIGISQRKAAERYTFLIASPEKALCDMIVATPRLYFQSVKAVGVYLEEDLRFEMEMLKDLDTSIIERCAGAGKKEKSLEYLLKFIRQ
jgi:predicted transcriptional regulator of viral defense system